MRFQKGDRVAYYEHGYRFEGTVARSDGTGSLVEFDNGTTIYLNDIYFERVEIQRPAPAVEPCPECHGRGSLLLFTSVSACSRGCGP